ncbi:DUF4064 domain-containing protein [Staphylococcus nepalensis]|uniref:DUF4064 domain-containing protein n=1 Tax=Staphylococcus nepalensis TaxID=214473 RepID=UPI003A52BB75
MKRTVEKVLAWLGILIQFVVIFLMAIAAPFLNDESYKSSLMRSVENQDIIRDNLTQTETSQLLDNISQLFIIALGTVIITTILALIFVLLINKLPKTVGVILVLLAIVTVFTLNLLTALLWLIAGIILLVRQPNKKSKSKKYIRNR